MAVTRLALLGVYLWILQASAQISVGPLQPTTKNAPSVYVGPQNPDANVPSSWDVFTTHPSWGIIASTVPGTEVFYWGDDEHAGVYNYANNTLTNVTWVTDQFCAGGTVTSDGKALIVGGADSPVVPNGLKSIRVYDYQNNPLFLPVKANLSAQRWYPTAILMPDNTVMVTGGSLSGPALGTSDYFERWSLVPGQEKGVNYPIEPQFLQDSGKNFYPFMWVLPTGEVFVLIDQYSRIIKNDNTYRLNSDGSPVTAPLYPSRWKTQWPRSGTAAMTAFTYKNGYSSVDVVVSGGTPATSTCNCTTVDQSVPANPFSYRLTISWKRTGSGKKAERRQSNKPSNRAATTSEGGDWQYTFSNWQEDDMGIPRVGGDTVLLPNGDMVIMSGAQTGCVGGVTDDISPSNNPALWPLLYQPDRDLGSRYTLLAASTIARTYHSTSLLTSDGTILRQGCDQCPKSAFTSGASFWSPNPRGDSRETRPELFHPPYALDDAAKPKITSVQGATNPSPAVEIAYGQDFTITWESFLPGHTSVKVTQVSLVAPCAVTHGFDTNQRVVFLEIVDQNKGVKSLTVRVPANTGLLPPQYYRLFIMNVKTYGAAWWVKLSNPPAGTPLV